MIKAIKQIEVCSITPAVFEELFMEHYPRLVRFAVRFVAENTAEDMVQNCFMRLWDKRAETPLTNAKNLLFLMVRNECLNELKHRTLTQTESLDTLIEHEGAEQLYWQDFAPDADCQLLGKELEEQIMQALQHTSEKTQEIFLLSRKQELKNQEIALQFGITRQAVEKHIHIALDTLRKYLPKNLLPMVAILEIILLSN